MTPTRISQQAQPFLDWLDHWYASLDDLALDEVIRAAGGPERVAVVVVDLLVGFCSEGPLASPRVAALGPPAARFLEGARNKGVRHVIAAADSHAPDSPEFASFPPHCIRGTREAEVIEELAALPFWPEVVVVAKGSLNVAQEPAFREWQAAHPEVTGWIIIGDCTDLCVHQTAMDLRLQANAQGLDRWVYVPAEQVDTYDLPVTTAEQVGAFPHPGDFLHRVFLYHMALNGVSVVRRITP